jgi:hypothetical protein
MRLELCGILWDFDRAKAWVSKIMGLGIVDRLSLRFCFFFFLHAGLLHFNFSSILLAISSCAYMLHLRIIK